MFPLPYAAYRRLGKGTLQNYKINSGKESINEEEDKKPIFSYNSGKHLHIQHLQLNSLNINAKLVMIKLALPYVMAFF